jgi:hypothetical protein
MAVGQAVTSVLGAALLALTLLGYILYQAASYRLLCNRWRRLGELRAGQRHLYRSLEALQRRSEGLLACVPSAVRPAPFSSLDGQAMELAAALKARLLELRDGLRALDPGPRPRLDPLRFLWSNYRSRLHAVEAELRHGLGERRALAAAEALADDLAGALAAIARKPLELQRSLAELQAMAETLAADIAAEERRGTAGLVSLSYEVQAARQTAVEWAERLRSAREPEAWQVAVEAEALRAMLADRLWGLLERAQDVVGVHDQALDWQARLEEALVVVEADQADLAAALADVLQPAIEALRREQEALAARYDAHDVAAYREVAQQAWSLTARARALAGQVRRLGERQRVVAEAVAGCSRAASALRADVLEEERQSGVTLDLTRALLERAEGARAELERAWADAVEDGQHADEAAALAALAKGEELAVACRELQDGCRRGLLAWQAQRRRVEEVLERLERSESEHDRVRRAWRGLHRYGRENWPQMEEGWYDRYVNERQRILEATRRVRAALAERQVVESNGSALCSDCEALEQRWQTLMQEGYVLTMALRRVQAAERQVREGVRALEGEAAQVVATLEVLSPGPESAGELRRLCQEIVAHYEALQEGVRHPEEANLARLRDEQLAGLQALLAAYREQYARLMEDEREALEAQMAALWAQWEPLAARLAKATPASEVDRQGLQTRWQELLQASRGTPAGLQRVLDLRAEASALGEELTRAQAAFEAEREAARQAEQRVAYERHKAGQLRDQLPGLLKHAHPQVVDEEWERSTGAWSRAEALLCQLEPGRGVSAYVARLEKAAELYVEAHVRARSALIRLVRYAYLEDPEGMRAACSPLGRRWERLGVTVRERQIGDLLGEVEKSGQVARLLERIGQHLGAV